MSKIRKSARNEDCSLRVSSKCQDGETVVLCHINSNRKGVGMKSPDIFGLYGCFWCHQRLDAGLVDDSDTMRAWQETLGKLLDKGLISEN